MVRLNCGGMHPALRQATLECAQAFTDPFSALKSRDAAGTKLLSALGVERSKCNALSVMLGAMSVLVMEQHDAALAVAEPERVCTWTNEEDGPWHTGCGHAFEFIADGPDENGFKHCCYCGGKLQAKEASNAH